MSGAESSYIGRVGERHFDSIADRERIIVAKPEPDLLGRDRILEFDRSLSPELVSFDKRLPPIGCSVQIKTIRGRRGTVRVSLSVAERLAGDPRPAFVCIIRIDESDRIIDMHLVHLIDGNLGRILERLRIEFRDGNSQLNRKYINFRISDGVGVDLSPNGLRKALVDLVGDDMGAYALKKMEQRKTIGFDSSRRHSVKIAFEPLTRDELIDGMLGLKDLPFKSAKRFEERFGVPLKVSTALEDASPGVLKISPNPVEKCKFLASCEKYGEFEYSFDVLVPQIPGINPSESKIYLKSILLGVVIDLLKKEISFNYDGSEEIIAPLREIEFFAKLFSGIKDGIDYKIFSDTFNSSIIEGRISDIVSLSNENVDYFDHIEVTSRLAINIFDEINCDNPVTNMPIISREAKVVGKIYELIFNSMDSIQINIEIEKTKEMQLDCNKGLKSIIIIDTILLGVPIVVCNEVEFCVKCTNDSYLLSSLGGGFIDAVSISMGESERLRFIDRMKKRTGIGTDLAPGDVLVLNWNPSTGDGRCERAGSATSRSSAF